MRVITLRLIIIIHIIIMQVVWAKLIEFKCTDLFIAYEYVCVYACVRILLMTVMRKKSYV